MFKGSITTWLRWLYHVVFTTGISLTLVFLYHHYYLRPNEMIVVDFHALSDAKLAQMVDDARNGHPVTPSAIKSFIGRVHQIVAEEAKGRPVYLAGAVFNPGTDLTLRVAKRLNIDLDRANSMTLPAMADRVAQSIQLRKNSSFPESSNPAESE